MTYKLRVAAEFAKEAMANQQLDHDEVYINYYIIIIVGILTHELILFSAFFRKQKTKYSRVICFTQPR